MSPLQNQQYDIHTQVILCLLSYFFTHPTHTWTIIPISKTDGSLVRLWFNSLSLSASTITSFVVFGGMLKRCIFITLLVYKRKRKDRTGPGDSSAAVAAGDTTEPDQPGNSGRLLYVKHQVISKCDCWGAPGPMMRSHTMFCTHFHSSVFFLSSFPWRISGKKC